MRCPETPGHFEAMVVGVDNDQDRWCKKLRRHQCSKADWPGADDGNAAAGLHLAVEDTTFETCRQDVAEHRQRFLIGAVRYVVQAEIRMWNTHILRLGAVDPVAEDPAAVEAVRIHPLAAVLAAAAGGDTGDQHAVAGPEAADCRADGLHHADALMPEDRTRPAGRDVAFQNMQVGAADGRPGQAYDGVARLLDHGFRAFFQCPQACAFIDECSHRTPPQWMIRSL
jgi:hypothetical protein